VTRFLMKLCRALNVSGTSFNKLYMKLTTSVGLFVSHDL